MKIEYLQLFIRVASTLNISQAGQELGLSPAVASMHINKLEQELGARLIHRTTRKISLTEEGRAFLPHAEEILASIEAGRASVGNGSSRPQGVIKVTASASFGRLHLIPKLKGFFELYPELSVNLHFSDTMIDLVEGGYDVAIRNAALKDSSLIAKKIADDTRILCASREYIDNYGAPKTPDELDNHQCICLANQDVWTFSTPEGEKNIKVSGYVRVDHGEALRDACVHGLGITKCAKWVAYEQIKQGKLVQILEDFPLLDQAAIWAVYPSSRLLAPKVRAFIDYFSQCYGNPPYWETEV